MTAPSRAQYLLRFDDLCPTMSRAGWERFVPLLRRYEIKPILAVVPANADPDLMVDATDDGFWEEMCGWEKDGAEIGLHGYRHVCAARGRGLLPLHEQSEFAGVQEGLQREWIRAGLAILRAKELEPGIWVAPRHGFDLTTLRVLREEGLGVLSDGFADSPFDVSGVRWIPQQLWGPREKKQGVWTICLHANTATDAALAELAAFLEQYAGEFTSVKRVLAQWPGREQTRADRWFHAQMMGRIRIDRWRRAVRSVG